MFGVEKQVIPFFGCFWCSCGLGARSMSARSFRWCCCAKVFFFEKTQVRGVEWFCCREVSGLSVSRGGDCQSHQRGRCYAAKQLYCFERECALSWVIFAAKIKIVENCFVLVAVFLILLAPLIIVFVSLKY